MMDKFRIQRTKTGKFLRGYQGNKPLWTKELKEAAVYSEKDASSLKRRLWCQSQLVEAVAVKSLKTPSNGT